MFLRAHIILPSNSREELYRSLQIKNSNIQFSMEIEKNKEIGWL